jgi:hypothetical protein
VTQEHEVLAAGLGTKVGVERQESVDPCRGGAEVLGYHLGRFERYPTEVLVDFLKSGKDELLRFLKIAVLKIGEDASDFVEIDIVFMTGFRRQF